MLINSDTFVTCPLCAVPFMLRVYPAAAINGAPIPVADAARAEAQAGCFYHAGRPANVVCEECGRFICALCEIEYRNESLCPACVRRDIDQTTATEMVRSHVRYDKLVFYLAMAPLLFWPLTIITGPAAVVMGMRYWNRPVSLVTTGRIRIAIAILAGFLQAAAWLVLGVILLNRRWG